MGRGVVVLPGILRPAVGEVRRVDVEGDTVADALDDLCRQHPAVKPRLFDESGRWRPHVLCIHHDYPVTLSDPVAFADGDELMIMPAVSGG